ncbi:hypothetical protein [Sphingobium boeckii]|uniref:Uncharacterized protein n=1 Tax=Sphingobium boeckii TaxID=1082345 RepID=A0A7W9EE08_9SPHN|nr:hypothetical protein [Sphingobium boeckii]MBB5684515.1 hypothetical protein [Sphingobium boeckii]
MMNGGRRDYWLERARQCRAYASTQDTELANRLLEIARRYERLAEPAPLKIQDVHQHR